MALASTVTLSSVQSAKVQHGTLDNGLEIYVYEDRSTPAVSMNLWYKVGSRDEPAELQGMAHLLEHMMFNGSKGIPKNVHAHLIDAVGGVLNAFTTNDVTVYWNKVPSNLLGAVLQLEADRMVNLEITPEKVKVEKEVVKEEYRMGLQNDPLGTTLDKLLATSLEGTPMLGHQREVFLGLPRLQLMTLRSSIRITTLPIMRFWSLPVIQISRKLLVLPKRPLAP